MAYDPFNPENVPVNCPSCQKRPKSFKPLRPLDATTRQCQACGRVERWVQPARKLHGDRRFERLLARQKKQFGDLEVVLAQWVADPEPEGKGEGGEPPT